MNDQGTSRGDEQEPVPELASLLSESFPVLLAYIRLHAGDVLRRREGSLDLAQSVCREVLANAEQFEFRGSAAFRAWLFQQALHKIVNKDRFHRAQKRDVAREVVESSEDSSDELVGRTYASLCTPSRVAIGREHIVQLERAFDLLPEDQREAIVLKRLAGLDYAEIAEQLERSEGAVRNLVHRGVAKLAMSLDADS